ncbi:hypothetical protein NC651_019580 [Populus alba x Populus x berolinensis]|nr:hypothetical protein NC651_019580 [Populus alba x Populus x berolinensis]
MDLEPEVEKEIHSSDGETRDSEVQKIHQGTSLINEDIHVSARVILVNQPPTPSPVIKCSNIDDKSYSRPTAGKGRKRKGEVEQLTENKFDSNGFIRSPCEGLRPRAGKDGKSAEENPIPKRSLVPTNMQLFINVFMKMIDPSSVHGRVAPCHSSGHGLGLSIYGCTLAGSVPYGNEFELRPKRPAKSYKSLNVVVRVRLILL